MEFTTTAHGTHEQRTMTTPKEGLGDGWDGRTEDDDDGLTGRTDGTDVDGLTDELTDGRDGRTDYDDDG